MKNPIVQITEKFYNNCKEKWLNHGSLTKDCIIGTKLQNIYGEEGAAGADIGAGPEGKIVKLSPEAEEISKLFCGMHRSTYKGGEGHALESMSWADFSANYSLRFKLFDNEDFTRVLHGVSAAQR